MYICHAHHQAGKQGPDVGLPSVFREYVLLSLVNKEAAFGQWLNRVNPGRKSKQRCTKRVGGVRENHVAAAGDRYLMEIHRLREMG